jgi:membrane protease YdiL (CAAX protease family)
MGWTGFATPESRKRHKILGTGLVVGLLWGLWHLPLFLAAASSSTADGNPAIYTL